MSLVLADFSGLVGASVLLTLLLVQINVSGFTTNEFPALETLVMNNCRSNCPAIWTLWVVQVCWMKTHPSANLPFHVCAENNPDLLWLMWGSARIAILRVNRLKYGYCIQHEVLSSNWSSAKGFSKLRRYKVALCWLIMGTAVCHSTTEILGLLTWPDKFNNFFVPLNTRQIRTSLFCINLNNKTVNFAKLQRWYCFDWTWTHFTTSSYWWMVEMV